MSTTSNEFSLTRAASITGGAARKQVLISFWGLGLLWLLIASTSGQTPGTKLWEFPTGGEVTSSPAVGVDGTLYFGSMDGKLYALNPNGTKRWDFAADAGIEASPAVDVDGTIYFLAGTNAYALYPNGTNKWKYSAAANVTGAPAIGGRTSLYFSTTDGKLYSLSRLTGAKKWTFTAASVSAWPQMAVAADGTVYVRSNTNLVAIGSGGTLKWTVAISDVSGLETSSPIITADGTVFVVVRRNDQVLLKWINPDGTIKDTMMCAANGLHGQPWAVIGPDGTLHVMLFDNFNWNRAGWPQTLTYWIQVSRSGSIQTATRYTAYSVDAVVEAKCPSIASDGTVYFAFTFHAAGFGDMRGLQASGSSGWFLPTGDDAGSYASSPTIGPDGTVYCSVGTNLWAVAGSSPPAHSPWPMAGRDLRRSCTGWYHDTLPFFDSLRPTFPGARFNLFIPPGSNYIVQASIDLTNWTPLTNVVSANGAIPVVDSSTEYFPYRFYRAIPP